jgi:cyclic pyranopterin phosphate synthase
MDQTDLQNSVNAPNEGQRLHVCVGPSCNNNCLFCIEDNREARFDALRAQTDEDIRRILLDGAPGTSEVMFVAGEPTLNPSLFEYVGWARAAGFRSVGVITNGRRLSYLPYVRGLLEAGVDLVQVSIHGPDAATHDALTRTRGSFEQTLRGLANLAALRPSHPGLRIQTAYCVTRRNLGRIVDFLRLIAPFGPDQCVFNTLMPEGRGKAGFDTLMPRYRDVVAAFKEAVRGMQKGEIARIALLDVPACVSEGLPDSVRGYVERYVSYEMHGALGILEFEEQGLDRLQEGGQNERAAVVGDQAVYARLTRSLHDSYVRGKRGECHSCRYDPGCCGVFNVYVERFGWEEFEPVTTTSEDDR